LDKEQFFNRYVFSIKSDRLGGGAFGTVYKAYDKIRGEYKAIKIAEVKYLNGKEFSLISEVNATKNLDVHKNIANYESVYQFEMPNGIYDYAVMQFYHDGNLKEILSPQDLNEQQKYEISKGLLDGIHYLHRNQVIHRDFKPSNILISKFGNSITPKIADFGLSKMIASDEYSKISNSFGGGTLEYSAPEQLFGKPLKYNADLWALGVVCYEIFTGNRPFESDDVTGGADARRRIIYNNIINAPLPSDVNTIPPPFNEIIRRCLIKDPESRVSSSQELLSMFSEEIATGIAEEINLPPGSPNVALADATLITESFTQLHDREAIQRSAEKEEQRQKMEDEKYQKEQERIKAEERQEAERLRIEEERLEQEKQEEAKKREEERLQREKLEQEAKQKETERLDKEKREQEAKQKEQERLQQEKLAIANRNKEEERKAALALAIQQKEATKLKEAKEAARIKEELRLKELKQKEQQERERAAAEEQRKQRERIAKEKAAKEAKRKKKERDARTKAAHSEASSTKTEIIQEEAIPAEEERKKRTPIFMRLLIGLLAFGIGGTVAFNYLENPAVNVGETPLVIEYSLEDEDVPSITIDEIKKINDVQRLEAIILNTSDQEIKNAANGRIDKLRESEIKREWVKVQKLNTIEAYDEFRRNYPNNNYEKDIEKAISDILSKKEFSQEEDAWEFASKSNSISTIDNYLAKYPNGEYVEAARRLLQELNVKQEKTYWDNIKLQNNESRYLDYLNTYPNGTFANEAREAINDIKQLQEKGAWDRAVSTSTKSGYEDFANRYPTSKYLNKAKQELTKLEKSAYDKAIQSKDQKVIENFKRIYPKSKYIAEVDRVIKSLSVEKASEEKTEPEATTKGVITTNVAPLGSVSSLNSDRSEELPASIIEMEQELSVLPPGRFLHGCDSPEQDCHDDEGPARFIDMGSFVLAKYEVSQQLYKSVMGQDPSEFTGCPNCPVENVSYYDAIAFINKLNSQQSIYKYRLPTEAEWEYAATANSKYIYAGSDQLSAVGIYRKNSSNGTQPKGSRRPNKFDLHDMSGNVAEWCSDWYDEDAYKKPNEKPTGKKKVIRGGSWGDKSDFCRVSNRRSADPSQAHPFIGFRLARDK